MYFISALWDVVKTIWMVFANVCGICSFILIIAAIGAECKRKWGWKFGGMIIGPEMFRILIRNLDCVFPKNEDQEEA